MFNSTYYVDPSAPSGGDGSIDSPFHSLADAIAAAPSLPGSATIFLARGNYDPDDTGIPIEYTDKRLTFVGQALINQSPDPPTHGVWLGPHFTGGNRYVEVERTNCAIHPFTPEVVIIGRDAYVEAWGDQSPTFFLSGTPFTARMGAKVPGPGPIGAIIATNAGVVAAYVAGNVDMTGCTLLGTELQLVNAGVGVVSTLNGCTFSNTKVTVAHTLNLIACSFTLPVAFGTTGSGVIVTDLATYARGLLCGSTFPAATKIVDPRSAPPAPVQPVVAAVSAGVNAIGNVSLSYPSNAAGDLFVAQIHCLGLSTPAAPTGWTLQYSKANAGVTQYIFTRDARAAGGETGTATWTIGSDYPNQGLLYAFRNVAATSFIEAETDFASSDGTGHGPSVAASAAGRLACVFFASNAGADLADPIAGNTGGTWQLQSHQFSGLGALIQLQTAALAQGGTVTGGSCSLGGGSIKVVGIAFALVGAQAT